MDKEQIRVVNIMRNMISLGCIMKRESSSNFMLLYKNYELEIVSGLVHLNAKFICHRCEEMRVLFYEHYNTNKDLNELDRELIKELRKRKLDEIDM